MKHVYISVWEYSDVLNMYKHISPYIYISYRYIYKASINIYNFLSKMQPYTTNTYIHIPLSDRDQREMIFSDNEACYLDPTIKIFVS